MYLINDSAVSNALSNTTFEKIIPVDITYSVDCDLSNMSKCQLPRDVPLLAVFVNEKNNAVAVNGVDAAIKYIDDQNMGIDVNKAMVENTGDENLATDSEYQLCFFVC